MTPQNSEGINRGIVKSLSRRYFSLFQSIQSGYGTHSPPTQWVPEILFAFCGEVKNSWSNASVSPYVFMTCIKTTLHSAPLICVQTAWRLGVPSLLWQVTGIKYEVLGLPAELCADNAIHFKASTSEWRAVEVGSQESMPPPQNFCKSTLAEVKEAKSNGKRC